VQLVSWVQCSAKDKEDEESMYSDGVARRGCQQLGKLRVGSSGSDERREHQQDIHQQQDSSTAGFSSRKVMTAVLKTRLIKDGSMYTF